MYREKSVLNSFAKLAADSYPEATLNDSLKKIASSEALTPHQIEYVAGEANRTVWAKLFAMDKTASYDFPLADPGKVIDELQVKFTKQASTNESDLDYLSPPTSTKSASFDPLAAMGFLPESLEKTAGAARKEIKHTLQGRLEKMAALKDDIEVRMYQAQSSAEKLELEFMKEARALVLDEVYEERKLGMDKIAEFLRGCGRPEYGQKLIAKLAHVMKRQGLMKIADLKAPEQYIAADLPARIINGRHSLYITIKTLFDRYDDTRDLRNRYEIVDSSLPVVKEKVREL